ncbi:VOC family protein [Iodidimonas sp. SYSU 1G8]|uniref:VOC family protein n=1 Tax=Iodidimonas sp. SYSU 1G8 TaxID=3133967 RepID=UPI0031FF35CC
MTVQLNHTIVWCRDKTEGAAFVTDILGLPPAVPFADFLVVELANGVSLDFAEKSGPVAVQHYAFLIGEDEFDAIYDRIRERGLGHWADPMRRRPGEINRNDGGRGLYFEGPDGHFLEVITRPYGG